MKIEIWSDIACPWCYIGKRRFETALADFEHKDETTVEWRSFQLDPELPTQWDGTEAEYLSKAKSMPIDQVEQMFTEVSKQAAGEGLTFDFSAIVVANSFTAHRFLHFTKTQGLMDEAEEALLSGHFERGRDIGDADYLAEVAESLGIDPSHSRRVVDSDEYAQEVRADITEARSLGANGVPFFVVDRKYGISGAQPSEVFAQTLETAWTESRKLTVLTPGGAENSAPAQDSTDDDASPESAVCGPQGCG